MELFAPGHQGCAGCGLALCTRIVLNALGEDTILVNSTGCLEIISTQYPYSAFRVPYIHSLFENTAPVATGIRAALKASGNDHTQVVCLAGDGATFDIGFGALSGMFERNDDVLYICIDNEAYMNTGVQRSGSTPYGASTTTSPAGKVSFGENRPKKNLPAIAAAHGIPYVATASIAYPKDVIKKVKKAISIEGPKYLQIHAPCCTGWGFDGSKTIEIGRLAVETALFPIYESTDGKVTSVKKIKRKPVEEYLKAQRRFSHLFKIEGGEEGLKKIQDIADANAKQFGLDQ